MQIKTIKKAISHKLTDWLATITDENLRNELRENVLVSGGSITSMLLNEPVNDYDVYINDMNVLLRLATYYAKPFNIEIFDGRNKANIVSKIEGEYRNSYAEGDIEKMENIRAISIRTLKEDQIKLHLHNGGLKVNEKATEEQLLLYVPQYFSANAISLSNQLQIVLRFHGNNEQIHKTFDFLHATNYFTFKDGLVTNKEALESIICKQLRYQGSLYPLTTIIRIKKFLKRGWDINAGEMLKVMFQIADLNLRNMDVLEEQLIGVDVAYFSKLIEILREIDPKKLTPGYMNEIIDRVFNEYEEETNNEN